MLALLEDLLFCLLVLPLLLLVFLQVLCLLLLEADLLELANHLKSILDLVLELFLQVNHSVDIDRLIMEVSSLLVMNLRLIRVLLKSALVTEGPVVLDRHQLVQCFVVHQQDFLVSEAEVIFGHFLVAESCLDGPTNDVFAVKSMVVLKQVVQVPCRLLTLDLLGGLVLLLDTVLELDALVLVLSRLIALFTPVDSITLSDAITAGFTSEDSL